METFESLLGRVFDEFATQFVEAHDGLFGELDRSDLEALARQAVADWVMLTDEVDLIAQAVPLKNLNQGSTRPLDSPLKQGGFLGRIARRLGLR